MEEKEHDRLVSGDQSHEDKLFDRAIRPKTLDEYIGQDQCSRANGNIHTSGKKQRRIS